MIDGKRVRDRENGSSSTHQVVMECNLRKSFYSIVTAANKEESRKSMGATISTGKFFACFANVTFQNALHRVPHRRGSVGSKGDNAHN